MIQGVGAHCCLPKTAWPPTPKTIDYLGPMNMDAINELKEKQERYDSLFKELIPAIVTNRAF